MNREARRAASLYRRFVTIARAIDVPLISHERLTAMHGRMRNVSDKYNAIARTIPAEQSLKLIAHNRAFHVSRDRAYRRRVWDANAYVLA